MTNVLGAAVIEITGDTDQLDKDVTKAKTKIMDAFKSLDKSAGKITGGVTRIFGKAFSTIGKLAKTAFLGISAGVAAVGAGLGKLVFDAMPLEGVRSAFGGLTAEFEGGSAAMLKAMQDGSLGMVNQMDLMQSFNSAAQLVGIDFAQKLPDAMQYLSKVSAATGEDMGFMIDSMVKGVGRLSPMILDNLGIQVDMAAANEEATKIMAENADMTEKQAQQTALMNQVIEKLAENTASMPDVVGTAAQKWASFKTGLQDLGLTIGEALLPLFGRILDFFAPFIENMQGAITWLIGMVEAGVGLTDFFTVFEDGSSYLEGFFERLGLSEDMSRKLATAIITIGAWIRETLIPALSEFWAYVTEQIIPKLSELWVWLQETLPGALQWLKEHWDDIINVLTLVVTTLGTFIVISKVMGWIGSLITIVGTLSTAITTAGGVMSAIVGFMGGPLTVIILLIAALVGFLALAWKNNWFGIRDKLTEVWENVIKPTFEILKKWLEKNIPIAIERLKHFWENVLKPALERFGQFLTTTVFPFLAKVAEVIETVVDPAVEFLAELWETVLQPALEIVWDFITTSVVPLLEALAELISATLGVALTALAGIWQNVLLPALQEVWKYVEENLFPLFEKLGEWLSDKLTDALETLQGKIGPLKQAFEGVKSVIADLITKIEAMIQKIKSAKLPDWMTPGSPTPWEIGLRGVADAMNSLSYSALPSLSAELRATPNAITTNTNFNLNANYSNYQSQESLGETVSFLNRLYG